LARSAAHAQAAAAAAAAAGAAAPPQQAPGAGPADPASGTKRPAGTPPPGQPAAKRSAAGKGPESDNIHDVLTVRALASPLTSYLFLFILLLLFFFGLAGLGRITCSVVNKVLRMSPILAKTTCLIYFFVANLWRIPLTEHFFHRHFGDTAEYLGFFCRLTTVAKSNFQN
jgi:hypothetical protein